MNVLIGDLDRLFVEFVPLEAVEEEGFEDWHQKLLLECLLPKTENKIRNGKSKNHYRNNYH